MAINKAIKMGFTGNDEDRLERLAAGFRQHSGGLLDGCVLALDGVGVPIHYPYKKDVERQKDYHFCKGDFAIIVLAGHANTMMGKFLASLCVFIALMVFGGVSVHEVA